MNVLVVYGSKHGSTQGIAERIAETLRAAGHQAVARPVEAAGELAGYDAFVVGSAVYAGRWTREATEFVRRRQAVLASRPVWLFSSGPIGTLATRHEPAEPKGMGALRRAVSPRDHRVFFGAWDRSKLGHSKLGFAERLVAKRLPQGDFRDWAAIEAWADWPRVLEVAPDSAKYLRRTSRRIPLLRLVPATPATASDTAGASSPSSTPT